MTCRIAWLSPKGLELDLHFGRLRKHHWGNEKNSEMHQQHHGKKNYFVTHLELGSHRFLTGSKDLLKTDGSEQFRIMGVR